MAQADNTAMSTSSDSLTLSELNKAQQKLLWAQRRNAQFSQAEQSIDKEEEQLKEKKRCLVTKRLMLHGQYRDWVNNTITKSTILPYCKAWNRNFSFQLQTRFPREIRNMVYKNLWYFNPDRTSHHLKRRLHVLQHYTFTCPCCEPDTMAMFPNLMDMAQSLLRVDHEDFGQFFDRSRLPHYMSSEYVGALTAHEVGVSFYLSLCTDDLLQCQSNRISSVLKGDAFHLGLPTMELITSLTVHCKVDRYRTPPPKHKLSTKCKHTLSETVQVRKDVLKQDFSALLDVKKKQSFRLHIIMYQLNIRLTVLEEAMEALDEIFRSFQLDGASLTVTWTYRGHWEDAMGPPCHQLVACEITPKLEAPDDLSIGPAWKEELLQELEEADEVILSRHAKFYDEPVNNLQAHDRKAINRFVHNMYETDEESDTGDGEDIPPGLDSELDDDHECGFCVADSDGNDDNDEDDDYEL